MLRALTLQRSFFQPFKTSYKDMWEGVYIGATDAAVEGSFIWDATREPMTYKNWTAGQPDNFNSVENCVQMTLGFNGQWNDMRCDLRDGKQMTMCETLLPDELRKRKRHTMNKISIHDLT